MKTRIAHRMTVPTVRRSLYGICAGGLLTGVATLGSAAILAPTAAAAPTVPEQCTASGIAIANSSVSAKLGSYLESNLPADEALSEIATQAPEQAAVSYQQYFADHPQVATDIKAIQRPVTLLTEQCNAHASQDLLTDAVNAA